MRTRLSPSHEKAQPEGITRLSGHPSFLLISNGAVNVLHRKEKMMGGLKP